MTPRQVALGTEKAIFNPKNAPRSPQTSFPRESRFPGMLRVTGGPRGRGDIPSQVPPVALPSVDFGVWLVFFLLIFYFFLFFLLFFFFYIQSSVKIG